MPNPFKNSVLLIGCGKMGFALLDAWLAFGIPPDYITVIEPQPGGKLPVHSYPALADLPSGYRADIVVLAVKPQSMDDVLAAIPGPLKESAPLFLSIAAGRTLGYFAARLGAEARVVRAMPNMPALIGEGMTAMCAGDNLRPEQRQLAAALLETVGEVVWLDESKMDAVTALSGSGPAYVFYFIEALIAAGVKLGLDDDTARQLALGTVLGSVHLAAQSDEPLEALRRNVTSPGGTTEAALKIAMEGEAFRSLIEAMLYAAAERSKALST